MAKTYSVEIIETLSRVVEVEAEDIDAAMEEVQDMYRNCDIVLDADDFADVEILPFVES